MLSSDLGPGQDPDTALIFDVAIVVVVVFVVVGLCNVSILVFDDTSGLFDSIEMLK